MNPDDHRAIGKRLELFHFQEEAPGMVVPPKADAADSDSGLL